MVTKSSNWVSVLKKNTPIFGAIFGRLVDNYRTFAAGIDYDVERVQELHWFGNSQHPIEGYRV